MLAELKLTFDLETTSGRELFGKLQHLVQVPTLVPRPDSGPVLDKPKHSSIPDDPVRAEAARAGRQAAAAHARAAKAAKQGTTPGDDTVVPDDVLGPEPNGAGDQIEDPLGMIDPSMSPGEARDAGLALVREVYAAGKVAEVKTLQKEWQVAKFYDVPVEKGHAFYARVMQMAQATGIRK